MDNTEIKKVRPINGPFAENTGHGNGFTKDTEEEKIIRDAEAILLFLKHARNAPKEGEFTFIVKAANSMRGGDATWLKERILDAYPFCIKEERRQDMKKLFERRFGGFPTEREQEPLLAETINKKTEKSKRTPIHR